MPGKLGGGGRGGVADQHCILQHLTLVILLVLILILTHVRVRVHIYGFTIIFAAVCYNQKSAKVGLTATRFARLCQCDQTRPTPLL
jgi:hypothetical protein